MRRYVRCLNQEDLGVSSRSRASGQGNNMPDANRPRPSRARPRPAEPVFDHNDYLDWRRLYGAANLQPTMDSYMTYPDPRAVRSDSVSEQRGARHSVSEQRGAGRSHHDEAELPPTSERTQIYLALLLSTFRGINRFPNYGDMCLDILDHVVQFCDISPQERFNGVARCSRKLSVAWRQKQTATYDAFLKTELQVWEHFAAENDIEGPDSELNLIKATRLREATVRLTGVLKMADVMGFDQRKYWALIQKKFTPREIGAVVAGHLLCDLFRPRWAHRPEGHRIYARFPASMQEIPSMRDVGSRERVIESVEFPSFPLNHGEDASDTDSEDSEAQEWGPWRRPNWHANTTTWPPRGRTPILEPVFSNILSGVASRSRSRSREQSPAPVGYRRPPWRPRNRATTERATFPAQGLRSNRFWTASWQFGRMQRHLEESRQHLAQSEVGEA